MILKALFTSTVLALASDTAAPSSTIILRASVRIADNAEHVRLGDIALLEGEAADSLADVVIGPAPRGGSATQFSLQQVRQALETANVHWGRTHLNGRTVVVRSAASAGGTGPLPMAAVRLESAEAQEESKQDDAPAPQLVAALLEHNDLRCAVAEFMMRGLRVEPDALQIVFDPRDDELLDAALSEQRFQIEPVSNLRSARVELAIRHWDGQRFEGRRTINIMPVVRSSVLVLKQDVDRGRVIAAEDLEQREQWLAPDALDLSLRDAASVAGRSASARLREGVALRQTHLQRENIMRRGELVIVRCIVGGSVISLQAEARTNAALGDTIEFRKPGERDTFLATVTGRGSAVLDLSKRTQ